jgi:hypothetical protein
MRRLLCLSVLIGFCTATGCAGNSEGLLSRLGRGLSQVGRGTMSEGPNSDFRYAGPHKPPPEADLASDANRTAK